MVLKLYNTLSRKKEVFKPIRKGEVGIYSCGLTVYNYGHIGNYRAFVASDVLCRYLEFKGFKVKKVVNITDVDDKTIKESVDGGKSLKDFTSKYEKAFFDDEKSLNIKKAWKYPKATLHIKEMVGIISKLLDKGIAYKADDGIYFNVKRFKNYGKLSKVDLKELKSGVRIASDEYDKENVQDFALWKFWDANDGKVFWDLGIGKGRPGWHIECSAMSSKYLGQPFDIHTGGVDLIFPHHENEIAQSEACCGKKFVNYWLHNEWMMVNGKKMSKSSGNYFTVRDIVDKGFDVLGLRYFYLTGQYRTQLDFTIENLKNAENSLHRLRRIVGDLKDDGKVNTEYLKKFEKAMDDDLDSVKGLQVLWALVRASGVDGKVGAVRKMDSVLGLDLFKKEMVDVPADVMKMVRAREVARREKDWAKADKLRASINEKGFKVDDGDGGSEVSKL